MTANVEEQVVPSIPSSLAEEIAKKCNYFLVSVQDFETNKTALMESCLEMGQVECATRMFKHWKKYPRIDDDGWLVWSATNGYLLLVRLLLSHRSPINNRLTFKEAQDALKAEKTDEELKWNFHGTEEEEEKSDIYVRPGNHNEYEYALQRCRKKYEESRERLKQEKKFRAQAFDSLQHSSARRKLTFD